MIFQENIKKRLTLQTRNVFWLTVIAVVLGLQGLALLVFAFHFIPLSTDAVFTVLGPYKDLFRPEREMMFYRVFVLSVIVFQSSAVLFFRRRLSDPGLLPPLRRYACAETGLLAVLLLLAFKLAVYGPVRFLQIFFVFVLLCCFGIKAGWFFISRRLPGGGILGVFETVVPPAGRRLGHAAVFLSIFLIVYVPPDVALTCLTDNYIHLDSFVMSPGWASLKGHVLNVDTISAYGVGMPALLARLARVCGGFQYTTVLGVLMGLAVVYFAVSYWALYMWFRNALLAFLAVLIMMKMHLFSHGPEHFIWQTPSATIIRYFWDSVFFLLLIRHVQTGSGRFLWSSGLCVGVALCYLTDTGLYLIVAFYAYLFLTMIIPACREQFFPTREILVLSLSLFFVPWLCLAAGLPVLVGRQVFNPEFWHNTGEMMQLFVGGFGPLPIDTALQARQFFNFFLGLLMPLVYILTGTFVAALVSLRAVSPRNILAVIWSVYGLGVYHYYVCRSGSTSFYAVVVPFVMVLSFWAYIILKSVPSRGQRTVVTGALVIWILLMVTDLGFINYPRLCNVSGVSYRKRRETFAATRATQYIAPEDIDLIRRMTGPEDKVCLFSAWETAMLIQADRRPFFYYFRLVTPRAMDQLDFGGTDLITMERVQKTLRQFDEEKPPFVFIEKKLFAAEIPAIYYAHYQDLFLIVQYLREHYVPVMKGKHLLALQRKI